MDTPKTVLTFPQDRIVRPPTACEDHNRQVDVYKSTGFGKKVLILPVVYGKD